MTDLEQRVLDLLPADGSSIPEFRWRELARTRVQGAGARQCNRLIERGLVVERGLVGVSRRRPTDAKHP